MNGINCSDQIKEIPQEQFHKPILSLEELCIRLFKIPFDINNIQQLFICTYSAIFHAILIAFATTSIRC